MDDVLQRLEELHKEYFAQNSNKAKRSKLKNRKGPPSNAPLEDKIDAISVGTDERATFSVSPSRVGSRPTTRESWSAMSPWQLLSTGGSLVQHFPSRPVSRDASQTHTHSAMGAGSRPRSRETMPGVFRTRAAAQQHAQKNLFEQHFPSRPQSRETPGGGGATGSDAEKNFPSRPQSREQPQQDPVDRTGTGSPRFDRVPSEAERRPAGQPGRRRQDDPAGGGSTKTKFSVKIRSDKSSATAHSSGSAPAAGPSSGEPLAAQPPANQHQQWRLPKPPQDRGTTLI